VAGFWDQALCATYTVPPAQRVSSGRSGGILGLWGFVIVGMWVVCLKGTGNGLAVSLPPPGCH
jgi:hypothetical protein